MHYKISQFADDGDDEDGLPNRIAQFEGNN